MLRLAELRQAAPDLDAAIARARQEALAAAPRRRAAEQQAAARRAAYTGSPAIVLRVVGADESGYGPCGICGAHAEPGSEVALAVEGTRDLVCDDCEEQHGGLLARVRGIYIDVRRDEAFEAAFDRYEDDRRWGRIR